MGLVALGGVLHRVSYSSRVCWGVHVCWARLIFTLSMLLGCSGTLVGLPVLPKIVLLVTTDSISQGLVVSM